MNIYISRHGESVNNVKNIIGGDCYITEKGRQYSKFLGKYFNNKKIFVWTSSLKRTKETADRIVADKKEWKELDEIHSGDYEGMSITDIQDIHPEKYNIRNFDKVRNSYPNGETYIDLQKRVYPILDTINMNNNDILLIIAHKAVCRVIYSYFTKKSLDDCVDIEIYLHTLYKIDGPKVTLIRSNV